MCPYQQPNCVFCKRDLPHARHITQLEYLRIFGEMETYVDHNSVLGKSPVHPVGSNSAKQRIAS